MRSRALAIAIAFTSCIFAPATYAAPTYVWLDVQISSCKLKSPTKSQPVKGSQLKGTTGVRRTAIFRGTVVEVIFGPSTTQAMFVLDKDVPNGVPLRGTAVVLSVPKTSETFCKEAPGQGRRFALSKPCEEAELQGKCYRPYSTARAVEDEE